MGCFLHDIMRCLSFFCSNPKLKFICPVHRAQNCALCMRLYCWARDTVKKRPIPRIDVSSCSDHEKSSICENFLCTVCTVCWPTHNHASEPLALDTARHIGSEMTIKPYHGAWIVSSREGPTGSIKKAFDTLYQIVEEEDFVDKWLSFTTIDETHFAQAMSHTVRTQKQIFSLSYQELIKLVNKQPEDSPLALGIAGVLASISSIPSIDRLAQDSGAAAIMGFDNRDDNTGALTFKVCSSRHRGQGSNNQSQPGPKYAYVNIPEEVIYVTNGKPVVRIKLPGMNRPSWAFLADLARADLKPEAFEEAISDVIFRTTLFQALAPTSVPFCTKMSLLEDFKVLSNDFFQACQPFPGQLLDIVNRYSLLRFHDRIRYSMKSDMHLPIADILQHLNMNKPADSTIYHLIDSYINFWKSKLARDQAYTLGMYSRHCTDLQEGVLQLWNFVVNYKTKIDVNLPREAVNKWSEELREILEHINKRAEWFLSFVTKQAFVRKPLKGGPLLVDAASALDRSMPSRIPSQHHPDEISFLSIPHERVSTPSEMLDHQEGAFHVPQQSDDIKYITPSHISDKETNYSPASGSPIVLSEANTNDLPWADPTELELSVMMDDSEDMPLYICSGCDTPFNTWTQYLSHRNMECGLVKYCYACNTIFENPIFIFDHEEKCQGDRCFYPLTPCQFCAVKFPTCTALEDHMITRHPSLVRAQQSVPEKKCPHRDSEILSLLETEPREKQRSGTQPGKVVSPRPSRVANKQQCRRDGLPASHAPVPDRGTQVQNKLPSSPSHSRWGGGASPTKRRKLGPRDDDALKSAEQNIISCKKRPRSGDSNSSNDSLLQDVMPVPSVGSQEDLEASQQREEILKAKLAALSLQLRDLKVNSQHSLPDPRAVNRSTAAVVQQGRGAAAVGTQGTATQVSRQSVGQKEAPNILPYHSKPESLEDFRKLTGRTRLCPRIIRHPNRNLPTGSPANRQMNRLGQSADRMSYSPPRHNSTEMSFDNDSLEMIEREQLSDGDIVRTYGANYLANLYFRGLRVPAVTMAPPKPNNDRQQQTHHRQHQRRPYNSRDDHTFRPVRDSATAPHLNSSRNPHLDRTMDNLREVDNNVRSNGPSVSSVNRMGVHRALGAIMAQSLGDNAGANDLAANTLADLRSADLAIESVVQPASGMTWDMIKQEVDYQEEGFGSNTLRPSSLNDLNSWAPSPGDDIDTTSESLSAFVSTFLQKCYAQGASKENALANLHLKLAPATMQILTEYKRLFKENHPEWTITLEDYIFQLFKLYFRPSSSMSEDWRHTNKKMSSESFLEYCLRMKKRQRRSMPSAVQCSPDTALKNAWLESRTAEVVQSNLSSEEKMILEQHNIALNALRSPRMGIVQACEKLDQVYSKIGSPYINSIRTIATDEEVKPATKPAESVIPPARNSYIQRNRPYRKKNKSVFEEENEQDIIIEKARIKRMQSEPGDEDAMNFDPNMESLWEAQDKLVAALDPAEQEHYLRRLDMQRQGKFKRRCDKLGILPYSCFRCGHLNHNASECENFPEKLMSRTKCEQCGQVKL